MYTNDTPKSEAVKNAAGEVAGYIEYERGYGVHARAKGQRKTFLTNGYRAAIGAEFCGSVSEAKGAARRWVRATADMQDLAD
jgi:hypothetical protein